MPNPARASFEIELNGTKYTLRPTFESIMEFNDKAGLDIFEALMGFAPKEVEGKKNSIYKCIKTKPIVCAIWAGIKGEAMFQGKDGPTFSEIGRECQSHGIAECMVFAMTYLSRAVASDDDVKKQSEESQSPQA
jgi:hypothetical protein